MAWSNSKVFQQFIEDTILNVAAFDLDSDTFLVALYDSGITPDNDVSAANSAYGAGQWVSAGNEVYEAGQWAQGGVALASPTVSVATADVVYWDATDTASGSAADLADVAGCLIYDDTLASPVANQGVCYIYFGATPAAVVNGTMTISWHANGIIRWTL
jgi:hypothetical protein